MRDAFQALTVRGRAFLAAGLTTTACAVLLGYDSLMRVGILAIALPVITAVLIGRVRYRLLARRHVDPVRVTSGQPVRVQLELSNQGRMPAGLMLFEDTLPRGLGSPQRFAVDRMGPLWRRAVTYQVTPPRRGHFEIGPLSVRISDPFGFIELSRSFKSTSPLVVTPPVVPLQAIPLVGATAESGERRLRAASVGSAEDVTVREYRRGDDLRRVHWRSTARVGQLMVRREEEPWQDRATIVLDSRRGAYPDSATLEWVISAAASVGDHLAARGYSVQLLTERPTTRDSIADSPTLIVDELSALTPSDFPGFSALSSEVLPARGLVVALLGDCTVEDLAELDRSVPLRSRRMAVLVGPGSATSATSDAATSASRGARWLSHQGWQAVGAGADEQLPVAWARLGSVATDLPSGTHETSARVTSP